MAPPRLGGNHHPCPPPPRIIEALGWPLWPLADQRSCSRKHQWRGSTTSILDQTWTLVEDKDQVAAWAVQSSTRRRSSRLSSVKCGGFYVRFGWNAQECVVIKHTGIAGSDKFGERWQTKTKEAHSAMQMVHQPPEKQQQQASTMEVSLSISHLHLKHIRSFHLEAWELVVGFASSVCRIPWWSLLVFCLVVVWFIRVGPLESSDSLGFGAWTLAF